MEKYKTNAEETSKIVNKIIPWISDFTDSNNYNKLSKFDYEIIKEIHIKNISQRVKKVLGDFLLKSKKGVKIPKWKILDIRVGYDIGMRRNLII